MPIDLRALVQDPYEETPEERRERIFIEEYAKTIARAPTHLRDAWRSVALRVLDMEFGTGS